MRVERGAPVCHMIFRRRHAAFCTARHHGVIPLHDSCQPCGKMPAKIGIKVQTENLFRRKFISVSPTTALDVLK